MPARSSPVGGEEKVERREKLERGREHREKGEREEGRESREVNESKGKEGERIHKGRPQSKGLLGCAGTQSKGRPPQAQSDWNGML